MIPTSLVLGSVYRLRSVPFWNFSHNESLYDDVKLIYVGEITTATNYTWFEFMTPDSNRFVLNQYELANVIGI